MPKIWYHEDFLNFNRKMKIQTLGESLSGH